MLPLFTKVVDARG